MAKILKAYSHLQRYKKIITILVKYGFDDIVARLRSGLNSGILKGIRKNRKVKKIALEIRLRMVFEELGPTFIKLGQILSTRSDILPKKFITEFGKLQDDVAPISFTEIKKIIESEFQNPLNKIYKSFDKTPYAAASIAQVHRAVTLDGESVAVKIQRPDIKNIIKVDLEILLDLANLAEKYLQNLKDFNISGIISDFQEHINRELDFQFEARNINLFHEKNKNLDNVYYPSATVGLISGKVLTMEFVEGIKISEIEKLKAAGYELKKIASNLAISVLRQIFEFGLFHADPHAGNLLVIENNIVAFLDYGMVGYIDEELKEALGETLLAYASKNSNEIIKVILNNNYADDLTDLQGLKKELQNFIHFYNGFSLEEMDINILMKDIGSIISKYHIQLPPETYLILKALITVEGIGLSLDPTFKITDILQDYVKKIVLEKFNLKKNMKGLLVTLYDFVKFMHILPSELRQITSRIKSGKLNVRFEHRGLDSLVYELDRVSNRLSFSIIIASIIIGSSIIIFINKGPMIFGMPLLGLAGFIFAGLLGMGLLVSIIRRGRL